MLVVVLFPRLPWLPILLYHCILVIGQCCNLNLALHTQESNLFLFLTTLCIAQFTNILDRYNRMYMF